MVDQTQEINKKETWDLLTNISAPQQLPKDMTFNEGNVVSIVTYSILMVISGLANITVLLLILRRRRNSKNSSMMNPMLMNLAIADLMVTFLMMPLEIGWNVTVSWKAGDAMCRIMAFFRIFGLYLSGFVLMCISMDRYYAVLKPFSISQIKRRGTFMLGAAWAASTLCSAPQIMIFHVERHPNFTDYEQCVTFNFFKSHYHDLAYKYFGFVMMYGLPLVVIIFCYSSILCEIYKKYKDCCNGSETFRRSSAGFLGRARIRTLKMTITIVVGFIVCWTPYYVMCLWYWMDRDSAQKVDHRIQKALFIFASGNSLMNPVVYGVFNVRTSPQQNTAPQSRSKLSAFPDVVNGNQHALISGEPKRSFWNLQWQRSFSSDHPDSEDRRMDVKKRRFRWRLRTQQSFSSDGTDIAEPNSIRRANSSAQNKVSSLAAAKSTEIRRTRWRQKPQISNPSDAPDMASNQGRDSGWRSWLSHHHQVERLSSDEDFTMEDVQPQPSTSPKTPPGKPSPWRMWMSGRQTQQQCDNNTAITMADSVT